MAHREHTEIQDKKSSFQSTRSSTEPDAPTPHSGGQLSTQLGTAAGAGCGQLPTFCTVSEAKEMQTQILKSIQMSGSYNVPTEPKRMGPTQLAEHHMGTVWESRLNTSWPKFRKQGLLLSTTPYKYT